MTWSRITISARAAMPFSRPTSFERLARNFESFRKPRTGFPILFHYASLNRNEGRHEGAEPDSHGVCPVKRDLLPHCDSLATDPRLEPISTCGNDDRIYLHSVGPYSARTMIPCMGLSLSGGLVSLTSLAARGPGAKASSSRPVT